MLWKRDYKKYMKSTSRHYSSWKMEDIVERSQEAAREGDIETLSYCMDELSCNTQPTL